jgi:hypothetical protein
MDSTQLQTLFDAYIKKIKDDDKKKREELLNQEIEHFAMCSFVCEWVKSNVASPDPSVYDNLVKALKEDNFKLWNQLIELNKLSTT